METQAGSLKTDAYFRRKREKVKTPPVTVKGSVIKSELFLNESLQHIWSPGFLKILGFYLIFFCQNTNYHRTTKEEGNSVLYKLANQILNANQKNQDGCQS